MNSPQHQAISVELCREWRDRYEEEEWSVGEIADQYDRGRTTVRRHVHDRCSHAVEGGEWGTTGNAPCPLCGETYDGHNLRGHLPECPANTGSDVAAEGGESA